MNTGLQQIELQILQLFALIVGAMVVYALKRLAELLGIKLSQNKVDMLNSAVDKAMTYAVTQAAGEIAAKGWDHVDSRNAVINTAINVISDKFADTLKANGVDLSNLDDQARVMQMMERMWPDVAARAAASPVTPPTPAQAAAVIVAQPPAVPAV